jgi:hypothetical protein
MIKILIVDDKPNTCTTNNDKSNVFYNLSGNIIGINGFIYIIYNDNFIEPLIILLLLWELYNSITNNDIPDNNMND